MSKFGQILLMASLAPGGLVNDASNANVVAEASSLGSTAPQPYQMRSVTTYYQGSGSREPGASFAAGSASPHILSGIGPAEEVQLTRTIAALSGEVQKLRAVQQIQIQQVNARIDGLFHLIDGMTGVDAPLGAPIANPEALQDFDAVIDTLTQIADEGKSDASEFKPIAEELLGHDDAAARIAAGRALATLAGAEAIGPLEAAIARERSSSIKRLLEGALRVAKA